MTALVARVAELAEQVRGVSYGKEDASSTPKPGYLPVLRAGNITDEGLVFDDLVFVPSERISAKQRIRQHDVVIAASSGSIDVVGKAARALANYEGGFGAFCKVLRPGPKVAPGYFAHFFKTPDYRRHVSTLAAGININNLRNEHLDKLEIRLPILSEQQRIAEVLDRAEALRAKRRAALAQLDTLTQSIFLDMFGVSEHLEPTIGELLDSGVLLMHKDGNHGSLYPRSDDFGDKGVPFLSAKAVTDDGLIDNALVEHLREDKAEKLRIGWILKGDVLLAHNASVGKVALYDGRFDRALIGTSLTAFRPNSDALDSRYLAAALRASKFQRQLDKNMGQTTRNQVPITAQRALRFVLPPVQFQREFAHRIDAVEKLKKMHRASLAELDALFASLQHRAFRGEL